MITMPCPVCQSENAYIDFLDKRGAHYICSKCGFESIDDSFLVGEEITVQQRLQTYTEIAMKMKHFAYRNLLFPNDGEDKVVEHYIPLLSQIISNYATKTINDFKEHQECKSFSSMENSLLRGCTYMFDKGIEIGYHSRMENDVDIEYNFSHLYRGMGNNAIPEKVLLSIKPSIIIFAKVYKSTFDHVKDIYKKQRLNLNSTLQTLLMASASLGVRLVVHLKIEE